MTKARSVTDLHNDFTKATAALELIPDDTDANRSRWERGNERCARLAKRIIATAADNVDEMLTKIRVAGYLIGAKPDNLDDWQPTQLLGGEEQAALTSIREDLRRMQAH